MKTKSKLSKVGWVLAIAGMCSLCWAGCNGSSPASNGPSEDPSAMPEVAEAQQAAQSVLGQDAEVLASGDLAKDGKEQVLAVNRAANDHTASDRAAIDRAQSGAQQNSAGPMAITRAVILEKEADKWREVLLCDENLKNPNGYLGGLPQDAVPGWELQVSNDPQQGEELRFTALSVHQGTDGATHNTDIPSGTFLVRWNPKAKLYETFDQSKGRFLSESSDQELSPSILK